MQKTEISCDICRASVAKDKAVEIRIDDKNHDLCPDCSAKLKKLLAGTGRKVSAVDDLRYVLTSGSIGTVKTTPAVQPWQMPVTLPKAGDGQTSPWSEPYITYIVNSDQLLKNTIPTMSVTSSSASNTVGGVKRDDLVSSFFDSVKRWG